MSWQTKWHLISYLRCIHEKHRCGQCGENRCCHSKGCGLKKRNASIHEQDKTKKNKKISCFFVESKIFNFGRRARDNRLLLTFPRNNRFLLTCPRYERIAKIQYPIEEKWPLKLPAQRLKIILNPKSIQLSESNGIDPNPHSEGLGQPYKS